MKTGRYIPYEDVVYRLDGYVIDDIDEASYPMFEVYHQEEILFHSLEEAERKIGGKYKGQDVRANWDFYLKEELLLPIENGQKKAMCVKMWRKGDFDKLVEFVEENYKFIGIEEC